MNEDAMLSHQVLKLLSTNLPRHGGITHITLNYIIRFTLLLFATCSRGKNAKFHVGGMPHVTKSVRKPEPYSLEFKVRGSITMSHCDTQWVIFDETRYTRPFRIYVTARLRS